MEAGRALDALVAERVMGWTKRKLHDEVVGPEWYWCQEWTGVRLCDSWKPSTDIAAAWLVFCRFTSRFLWYDAATDTWHCHVDSTRRTMGDCRYHATSEDNTGAEAICLAALQAIGVEV